MTHSFIIGISILASIITWIFSPMNIIAQAEMLDDCIISMNGMKASNVLSTNPINSQLTAYIGQVPTEPAAQATPIPFSPQGTSTPDEYGSIYHVVQQGESLWSIAISYGVTIQEIQHHNDFIDDSLVIRPGQKLLIIPIYTPPVVEQSETMTATSPPVNPQGTPIAENQTIAAATFPSSTSTSTPESTPTEDLPKNNPRLLVALVIIFIALVIVLIDGFRTR